MAQLGSVLASVEERKLSALSLCFEEEQGVVGVFTPKQMLSEKSRTERRSEERRPEYRAYIAAKKRCTNPNTQDWPLYGGRGIRFLFSSFQEFLAEIGSKPSSQHSIDRIDTDGHYCAGNVRWATAHEQRVNQRPKGTSENSIGAV